MKKTLNRALLQKAQSSVAARDEERTVDHSLPKTTSTNPKGMLPGVGGAGSAWKAGAAEQNRAALVENRKRMVKDILAGRHELLLQPGQVTDRIGSDRREDWRTQNAFQTLKDSIERNGQDTPIQVWPSDPNWLPDSLNPESVDGIEFDLIIGRRRHAIAADLGLTVRAILAPPDKRGDPEEQFETLYMRFRENEERENLGPFERLSSIGEMFEELHASSTDSKPTAVSFANKIGVHESIVSRGRAVFKARKAILNKFKNAYDMSYPELQKAVSSLANAKSEQPKSINKTEKISVTRKVGGRKLSITTRSGKLSMSGPSLDLSKEALEGLGDMIADYMEKHRLK